ncbi:MAG: diguanylate cyclase [Cyanobacteria bacterium J06638_28]
MLALPFLLQTVTIVSLVGFLSHRTGQEAVSKFAEDAVQESANLVEAKLDKQLEAAHHINELNIALVRLGQIDLQDTAQIEQSLLAEIQENLTISAVLYGNLQGTFRGFYRTPEVNHFEVGIADPEQPDRIDFYTVDETANRIPNTTSQQPLSIKERPWYVAAMANGHEGWTSVVQSEKPASLVINAYKPIHADPEHNQVNPKVLGVFAVSLDLTRLDNFLAELETSHDAIVFITEPDGSLIATSTTDEPFYRSGTQGSQSLTRMAASNSPNPTIAKIGATLYEKQVDAEAESLQVKVDDEKYFVHHRLYQDLHGLEWRLTTAVPNSHFVGYIEANFQRTLLICLLVLLGDLAFLFWITHWIANPIMRLHHGAQQLASGKFEPLPDTHSSQELQGLTTAFNEMAQKVQLSMTTMRSLMKKLFESEARISKFLDALPVGIVLHDSDGKAFYLNQVAQELLHIDKFWELNEQNLAQRYGAYQVDSDELYPAEKMPSVLALQGKSVIIEDLELRRQGQNIAVQVQGTPIWDEAQQVAYAIVVFQDVTLRKQAEKVVSDYNRNLELRVWERTLALEREIQERQRMENQLRESQTTQAAILAAIPDLLIRLSSSGIRLSLLSEGVVQSLEGQNTDGQESMYDVLPYDLAELRMQYVQQALATDQRQVYEHTININGKIHHEETRIVKLSESEVLVMVRDITDRKHTEMQLQKANAKLAQLALTDGLTQVSNRRCFDEFLGKQWWRLQVNQQPISMILLDIDYFKRFNDTYGHRAGDDCLQRVAQQLQFVAPNPNYLIARYGGEEFALVLPQTDVTTAVRLAQQIHAAIRTLAIPHTAAPLQVVSVSMGISAIMPTPAIAPETFIEQADQALYIAKQSGRDSYSVYTAAWEAGLSKTQPQEEARQNRE